MTHENIIKSLGGTVEVSRLCECSPQAVSQWFGTDPATGKQRLIPNSRLLYLRAIRPDIFKRHAAQPDLKAPSADGDDKGEH